MRNNIVFVSNCDLFKDLINNLLGEDNKLLDCFFSCCDAANLLTSDSLELFIIAHEFIEDSLEDYQDYLNLYKGQCKTKPILLCDEFDTEQANQSLNENLIKEVIVARPLSDNDKERLLSLLYNAISKRESDASAPDNKQFKETQTVANKPSILVIEDDDFFSDVYKSSLMNLNMEIIVVADCNAASDAIYLNKPRLIFLDYNLPDFNGFEFLQSIKSDPSLSDIPVIVVTGESDPELNKRSQQIGATKFLKKPINAKEISIIANAVLREHQLEHL